MQSGTITTKLWVQIQLRQGVLDTTLCNKFCQWLVAGRSVVLTRYYGFLNKPEALKSLYRSPGNKKNQLVLCKNYVLRHLGITINIKNYVLRHLGITINIKNTKFVKDLPMIDAQFRFNQCYSFREEYISVFSPYSSVLILWPVVAAILDFRST